MRFEFASVGQMVFGAGVLAEAGRWAAPWGNRGLIVTGGTPSRADGLRQVLAAAGLSAETYAAAGEPTIATVTAGVTAARASEAKFVIGFGGGSALDAAKAIAGLLTNPGEPLDYLEVVGRGQALTCPALPWMAIPTTAGTGAEVTRNAVLGVPAAGVKASLRSPFLLARVALIDPALALGLPPAPTAATGLDALTQLIEAYVCLRANPFTDALAAAGIPRVATSLPTAWHQPEDLAARSQMALASLWSGLALANAGLGAVHGLAAPLGGRFYAPHGAVCAALLGPVMAANLAALRARHERSPALGRYDDIARWLTGRPAAQANDAVAWVHALVAELAVPSLSAYGITPANFSGIAEQSLAASSMKANPVALRADELVGVLQAAL